MPSILIENGVILTANDQHEVFQCGYVLIEGDRIVEVLDGKPPEATRNIAQEVIDAAGHVIMPGMVNAHVHLQQTLIRGLSDDKGVLPWVTEVAFPVYEQMREEEIYLAELLGMVENIRGGATSVTDNLTVRSCPAGFDSCFRAAKESGIRYKLARGFNERNAPEPFIETTDEIIEDMRRLYETWHNQENGRLRIDFNPHSLRVVTEATLRRVYELSQEWGIGIHLHTSEFEAEAKRCINETGQRQVEWLAGLGILGPHFQLAHSVWLDDHEIELIAETGACVVHNPVSNMFTGVGVAPVPKLLKARVPVALGTDGQAVANGQEIIDVLKWAVNLHKANSRDATIFSPEQVIHMACRNGAIAFGQPDLIGSLEAGKKADLILVDLSSSRLTLPTLNIPSLIVNFARTGDVDTVVVDGKFLMREGKVQFLDEEALLKEFREVRRALLQRATVL